MNLIWEVGTNISDVAHWKEIVRRIELGQDCVQW